MGDNDLEQTDLPPFKRKPGWDGAVGKAESLHQQYVDALDEWGRFQKKHGDKVQLWDTARQLIVKSANADGISTQHLYDALGVSAYHEDEGTGWDISKGVHGALEFESDPDMPTLAAKAGSVNDGQSIDNEFVRFGREIVTRRAAVEVAANRLIHFLKFGEKREDPPFQIDNTGIAEKTKPKLDLENEFYADFVTYDFVDQVIIVKELTYGLGNSQRGKDFLANLFEYQYYSIFDPFGFTSGRHFTFGEGKFYTGDEAIEAGIESYISVFIKDYPAFQKRYLTADGRITFEGQPDVQTDSFAEHMTQLITQLYPGLMHFHATRSNDSIYQQDVVAGRTGPNGGSGTPNPDPDAVVSKFTRGVLQLFVNDDQIRSAIDDIDWANCPYDKPSWSKDYLKPGGQDIGWGTKQTQAIAAMSVGSADAFVGELDISEGRWIGPFKLMFATMGVVAGYTSLYNPGSATFDEQVKNLQAIGKGLTDLATLERYLPEEYADEIAEINRGAKLVNMGRKAARILGTIGVALDVLGVILNTVDMAQEMQNGDYDAAAGYAILGLSGVAGLGATAAGLIAGAEGIGFAVAATLGIVSGILLVIALVLGAIGTAVLAWCDESAITEWLRYTRFGEGWDGLDDDDILDPAEQTFRYKHLTDDPTDPLGGPDFVRQISALHSLVRPIGLTTADLGTDSREGHSGTHTYGTLGIEPYEEGVWSEKSDVAIFEDGLLFVRPVRVIEEAGVTSSSFTVSQAISGEYLHRISLRDEPGQSDKESRVSAATDSGWKTSLGEHEPNPFIDMIERYTERDLSPTELDLEITTADGTTNDHGEANVTEWTGTFWSMAGDGADVFGWKPGEIQANDGTTEYQQYVEVLYVPPDVAREMREQDVEINPQDLPTITRERLAIDAGMI